MPDDKTTTILKIFHEYEDDPENMDCDTRRELEEIVDFDVFVSYCGSDMPSDTIAQILVGYRAAVSRKLDKDELRSLIISFNSTKESEAQCVLDALAFAANCKHPAKTDLLFYPETVFGTPDPTTDENLEKALRGS